jgi:hypothetical protein
MYVDVVKFVCGIMWCSYTQVRQKAGRALLCRVGVRKECLPPAVKPIKDSGERRWTVGAAHHYSLLLI